MLKSEFSARTDIPFTCRRFFSQQSNSKSSRVRTAYMHRRDLETSALRETIAKMHFGDIVRAEFQRSSIRAHQVPMSSKWGRKTCLKTAAAPHRPKRRLLAYANARLPAQRLCRRSVSFPMTTAHREGSSRPPAPGSNSRGRKDTANFIRRATQFAETAGWLQGELRAPTQGASVSGCIILFVHQSCRIAAAIRAFGLYFSEIREFDSKSVPPG